MAASTRALPRVTNPVAFQDGEPSAENVLWSAVPVLASVSPATVSKDSVFDKGASRYKNSRI